MKLLILAMLCLIATPPLAQSVTCLPREALIKTLQDKHGEHLNGGGLRNKRAMIEVWSSDETGSFTVFIARADGMACIIATGKNWHNAGSQAPKTNPT